MTTCSTMGFKSMWWARSGEAKPEVGRAPGHMRPDKGLLTTSGTAALQEPQQRRSQQALSEGDLSSGRAELAKRYKNATTYSIFTLTIGTQACGTFSAKACGQAKLEVFTKRGGEDDIFLVRLIRTSKERMENHFTTAKAVITPFSPLQDWFCPFLPSRFQCLSAAAFSHIAALLPASLSISLAQLPKLSRTPPLPTPLCLSSLLPPWAASLPLSLSIRFHVHQASWLLPCPLACSHRFPGA